MSAIPKYLARYSEPESRIASWWVATHGARDAWNAVVVVPLSSEDALAPDLFSSLARAARHAGGNFLAVVVVNGGPDRAASNARTLDYLRGKLGGAEMPAAFFGTLAPGLDALVVDRASPGREFPEGFGVGHARKMGTDLALALHFEGRVRSRYLHTTDADARVDVTYFEGLPDGAAAVLHPYRHAVGPAGTESHALYEIHLRYYERGLARAGSPYAFQTLGSCIAVDVESYAQVRGFPKLLAAEDFYILNKLAKVGPIVTAGGGITLVPRASDRVPFGTGRATERIDGELARGEAFRLYHPTTFVWLGRWLRALDAFAETRDRAAVRAALSEDDLWSLVAPLGAEEALESAAATRPDARGLRRHLHEWFDAFRTLKFVHAVRDTRLSPLPWREALGGAVPPDPVAALHALRAPSPA